MAIKSFLPIFKLGYWCFAIELYKLSYYFYINFLSPIRLANAFYYRLPFHFVDHFLCDADF